MTSFSFSGTKFGHFTGRLLILGVLSVGLFLFTGCQYTGSMTTQPYNRPLSASDFFVDGRSARMLVPGTVTQTDQKVDDPALTGLTVNGEEVTQFPVPVTNELVNRGQERFDIYCVVCHGIDGHADGMAVTFGFPKPPDLLGAEVKSFSVGHIFNVITNGKDMMLSYAYRVKPPDRWAIIAYVRAMQLKGGHLTQDLTPDELQQLEK